MPRLFDLVNVDHELSGDDPEAQLLHADGDDSHDRAPNMFEAEQPRVPHTKSTPPPLAAVPEHMHLLLMMLGLTLIVDMFISKAVGNIVAQTCARNYGYRYLNFYWELYTYNWRHAGFWFVAWPCVAVSCIVVCVRAAIFTHPFRSVANVVHVVNFKNGPRFRNALVYLNVFFVVLVVAGMLYDFHIDGSFDLGAAGGAIIALATAKMLIDVVALHRRGTRLNDPAPELAALTLSGPYFATAHDMLELLQEALLAYPKDGAPLERLLRGNFDGGAVPADDCEWIHRQGCAMFEERQASGDGALQPAIDHIANELRAFRNAFA